MKRITVEMVKEAYAKTGLKPMQGGFYEREGKVKCACALGALYTAETRVESRFYANRHAINLLGNEYARGFVNGYDGTFTSTYGPEYQSGFEDGRAAWEAVKP